MTRPLRWLFWATVAWGASIIWMAPHPPMTDLPQHAGQIALWRELLAGRSQFADLVQVNLATPYLIGYGLALPLSFVFPVVVAIQCVFTLAYLAWVALCVALRKDFEGDPRLDWIFVIPMFGFAYRWGFLTFLVAAPLGLLLILLARRNLAAPSPARAGAVLLAGLALLMSHGLVFLYALATGAVLIAHWLTVDSGPRRSWGGMAWVITPTALLVVAAGVLFALGRHAESKVTSMIGAGFDSGWDWQRLYRVPLYSVGTGEDRHFPIVVVMFLAAPWLLSAQLAGWRDPSVWVLAATTTLLFLLPSYAASTAFLYERFGLFLLPAYAWCFRQTPREHRNLGGRPGPTAGAVMCLAACWTVLATRSQEALAFGRETRSLDAAIARLEPSQRMLSLMFDRSSPAARSASAYLHYGSWYQAERNGFTDFNFAWFPPQVVRFRANVRPLVEVGFDWAPDRFAWSVHGGNVYRYFLVRHLPQEDPSRMFADAPCSPVIVGKGRSWVIFERGPCLR